MCEVNRFESDIKDTKDFCRALGVLLNEPGFPRENVSTKAFIEAMQAWLEAFEGRNALFDDPNSQYVTWSDLLKLLEAAAVYE